MDDASPLFNVGEEVLFDGERYVIAGRIEGTPRRYRLLATTAEGAKVAWALPQSLARLTRYTQALDDTDAI